MSKTSATSVPKAVPQNDLLKTATNIMEDSPILGQLHLQNDDPKTIRSKTIGFWISCSLISSSIFKQTCSHAKSHDLLVPSTILHNGSGGSPPPRGLAHPKRSTCGWSISDLCEPEPEVARDTEPYFLSCRVFFHCMERGFPYWCGETMRNLWVHKRSCKWFSGYSYSIYIYINVISGSIPIDWLTFTNMLSLSDEQLTWHLELAWCSRGCEPPTQSTATSSHWLTEGPLQKKTVRSDHWMFTIRTYVSK